MDELTLRITLKELDMCRGSFDVLFFMFSWLVPYGVFLEFVVIGLEYWDKLCDFWKGVMIVPERPSRFLLFVEVVGVALVTGGISGEIWAQGKIGSLETAMRITSEALVGVVSGHAKDAEKSAKGAAAALESAQVRLRKLSSQASDLGKAQQKVADAQKQAIDAQQKMNNFLVERAAARILKNDIADLLKSLPPAKAEIWSEEGDHGAFLFARSILMGLKKVGWDVPREPTAIPLERFDGEDLGIWGIQVFDNRASFWTSYPDPKMIFLVLRKQGLNEQKAKRLAILMAALNATSLSQDATLPDNTFRIVVAGRGPYE